MALSQIEITFNEDLILDNQIDIDTVEGMSIDSSTWTWKASRVSGFQVEVGVSTGILGERAAINFASAFELDLNATLNYSVVVLDNAVTITSLIPEVTFLYGSSASDVDFVISDVAEVVNYESVNVRSPYFITAPIYDGVQLIDPAIVNFDFKMWVGDVDIDKPLEPNYTYKKEPLFIGDRNIYITIDKQASDFIKHEYNGTLSAECAYINSFKKTTYTDVTEKEILESNYYLAFDGYGNFKDGANPVVRDLMITNRHISVLSGENINIPFFKGGDDYTVTSRTGTTDVDTQNITSINITDTADAVEYLSFTSSNINNIRIVNDDTLEETIISVEVVEECTYEPIKCVFVNAKGVKQEFYFFKSNKENSSFKNENYKRNILSTDVIDNKVVVSYDTNKHTNKVYNKQGQKSIEVNSGYVDEDNNILIEELIMSEYVWLVIDSVIYPVDVDTKSLEYQTRLNDQLIKYKLKFKYSFDIKQNIR